MAGTRYEQYLDLNAVPFKFYWRLKRTAANAIWRCNTVMREKDMFFWTDSVTMLKKGIL